MTERASQRLPLTGAQTGVWYGQRLDPASPVYNVGQYIEIDGRIDPGLFARAVRRTVAEAEALTVRFEEGEDGEPVQVTGPAAGDLPVLEVVDHTAQADPRASALARMRADMDRATDPVAEPLFAFALHLLGPDRALWYQRVHHIALDAYGFSLLSRRTAEIYTALVCGDEPAPTPFGPLDAVIEEERAYRASERFAQDREHWLQRLADRPEPEPLSGNAVPASHAFLREGATLSADTTAGLFALARAARASWADVVTAAFAAYLHRSTGSRDVLLSLPAMARLGSAALTVPAMVVNVLPLRVAVRPDLPLGELVASVAGRVRDLRRHQRYRAEDVRRDLGLVGREQGLLGPMVNVKAFDNALDFAGCPGAVHNVAAGPVDDITLGLHHDAAEGRIRFEFDGNPRAYDAGTLAARCAEFTHLLDEAAAAGPDAPVGRLDLLPEAVRRALVHDAGATDHPVSGRTVVTAFAERARAHGDLPAVVASDATLTYAELDARSDRLARLLAARGAGPERIVGLALPRSAELLVAMLAVLKSGGAYLPLDLDYPADRLEFMVADARPVCVLTTLDAAASAPRGEGGGVHAVVLDAPDTLAELADLSEPTAGAPAAPPDGEHPAYVIHTSGSTGRPKGVVVPHAALANFLEMQAEELALKPGDRLVAVTTVSFDIAALEIYTPLISGATVVLADRDTVRDPAALAALIDLHRPAVVQATPSLWHALLEDGRPSAIDGVHALVGGEALPAVLAERLARSAKSVTNVYGPTEVTVWATSAALAPDHTGVPDIGAPFWNTRAHVLDGALRPAPAGRPGELYLAGAQLARGYLGRHALTAERFVADPYGEPGGRMYRTGDLVRRRPDGRIEFLGRADDQVKVRGFRIELGEIESALVADPSVARAVVVVREDAPGSAHLVGYVTPASQGGPEAEGAAKGAPDPAALRRLAAERLPEYMVPSAVVVLDAFPLTANGKIDRRALPAPDLSGLVTAGARAPRGAREEIVAGVLADVLGLEAVGPDDDFFALGGHSLLAARVIARVRTALGAECSIRDVFEARTAAALTARLGARTAAGRPPLVPAERPELLPLSYAQRRLWFLHQMEGPSAAYNIPFVARFGEPLDAAALDAALGEVVARHEALRTVFAEVGGEPCQRVLSPGDAGVRLRVLEAPEERFDAEAKAALGHLFDLAAEAPLRVTLLRDPVTGAHALVVLLHHIASDEWSMGPFLGGLERAYTAHREGTAAGLGELPVQYADYALWQRELLGDPQDPDSLFARQAAHWREALAGVPEELALPADRPRPAVAGRAGGMVHRALPAELAAGVRGLARESGTSVFMVVHAAVAALLHRLGAGDDIPLGSPVAGRGDEALDELVGFFVNTVVLRADLSGDPSFAELLDRVRTGDLAALDHTDLPFEAVVETLNPERSLTRHPLFQTMVSHSTVTQDMRTLFGLDARVDRVDPGVTKFDLDITFSDTAHGDELDLEVFYASDLFDRDSAQALADRLLRLLEQAVREPGRPVGAYELLSDGEREQIAAANATDRPLLGPATVMEVFAAQAAATPGAVAVVAGETTLTFAELDARADRLARLLADEGVGADDIVALALPRTADSVVAAFAVLKAGGAYLPLDLDHPAERLAHMLTDAAPVCVVTAGAVAPLPELPGLRRVVLDAPGTAQRLAALPAGPPQGVRVDGDHAAYVIYTSGSTGRPKGVVLTHTGLTHLHRDHERELYLPLAERLGRRVRALHTASFSFDSSWEQLLWLITGHELHLLDEHDRRDPEAVVRYTRAHGIDALDVTPSYARQLLDAGLLQGPGAPPLFLLGGEAVPPALWSELRARTDVETVNYYGPTEHTVDALVARVSDAPSPVVGRPLDNTRAHVLDGRLRPTPPGVPGELYLSGPQNARGYLGRPALTAERFTADPYGPPGARMYRTGDLARRRADGLVEYLGRTDHQTKIRGYRIEPGEVEAVLAALDGVGSAAVVVREDVPGDPRLVAYTTGPAEPETLREALAAQLPPYMVPSAVVVLDVLPTNVNGKLDHAALPAPAPAARAGGASRAPGTAAETLVARVFAEVLELASVGADEDFFRLGGHSLLATRVVARLRAAGVSCSVRDVFEARTVAALAARTAGQLAAERPALAAPAVRPELLPLSYAQHRLWFLGQMDGPNATYNVPFAVRLRGPLHLSALQAAVQDVVERHEALRTVYPDHEGEPRQRILGAEDALVPLTVLDVTPDGVEERVEAAADETFDLAVDLPLRVTVLRVAKEEHVLVVLLHHIATDEWSTGPLLADLDTAYRARRIGHAPDFAPLPVQYADYALWQRELLGDPENPASLAARQADHWRTALAGLPDELALPADRPRPAVPTHHGDTVEATFPAALVEGLDRLVRESGATMFNVVHAAVAALLHRHGAGDDIPLGSPVAGRGDEALDRLVGFFVNTVVLRTDLSGDPTFAELLDRVRAGDLAALDHTDLPFDAVVEAARPHRSPARHPLFQTMVAYEGGGPLLTRLFGTAAEELRVLAGAAKFDLDILVRRTREDGTDATGMVCGVRYSTDLFDRESAQTLADRLLRLLEQAVREPGRPVGAYELLGEAERAELAAGRPIDRPLPSGALVPQAVAAPSGAVAAAPESSAPRALSGAREEIVAGIFAQILGRASVGRDEDFFLLGGHSLLATRVVGRVRAALGVECGVRDMFEAPTAAALAARVAGQSAASRPELAPVAGRPERLPLSYAQRRLWLIDSVRGPGTTYNVPFAVRLKGAPDVEALRAALRDVVERHEVLRTVYGEHEGEPWQRVMDMAEVTAPLRVRSVPAGRLAAEAEAVSGEVFDLAADLPLRATLLRAAEDGQNCVLVLLLHHIATDEWSSGPLLADLDTAYRARSQGRAPALAPLPVQYADYALWQRELLGDLRDPASLAARQADHWRTALAGLPDELALPTDRPRPAVPTHQGDVVAFEVAGATSEALARIARDSGATMFHVVHAAVAALLHRLGAGDDIPLGSPVAGRGDEALDQLVGFFLNTLVLRADVSGDPTFAELVKRVRDSGLAAFSHADLPLEGVVEAVGPARSQSRNPLFQTMVTYYTTDEGPRELLGLPAEELPVEIGGAKLDLEVAFAAAEQGGRLSGGVRYATDLFDRAGAELLTERLLRLLDAVAAEPSGRVSGIAVMSAEERAHVLHGVNDTARVLDGPRTLAALVASGARERSADALVFEGVALSRGAFEERVNRLARLLIRRGVGPESVVAVALPRSPELLIAVHAVVRAGGAYLPLDLGLPADRLAYMAETAKPVCVLTDTASAPSLPPQTGSGQLVVDAAEVLAELAELPAFDVTDVDRRTPLLPRHPAYLIFTSGSTGRPKGVLVEHAAIVNRLLWMQGAYGLTSADRVLHKTPASFDVSVWELFWPLAQGAPLVVARPDGHRDPEHLAALIREQRVSVLHFVPSMLEVFLAEAEISSCPSLRLVACSGEALPGDLVERFHASAAGAPVALENLYGPTEAAVDVTAVSCPPGSGAAVSIGRPVWNTRVYVLDAALGPVPAGVPGELYLAGVQLARGYASRPGLTSERFVADPYGAPGTRMYRTGDLVRLRADGAVEYLGRTDDQVKLRGLRIELGEIEAVLASAPEVARAVVVVREDHPGVRMLTAYAVPVPGASVDPAALRALAAERLPEYMVPPVVLELERVPLSPNGKLDRRALPAPPGMAETAAVPAAPAAPVPGESPAEILGRLMGEVLGRAPAGPEANFFELGGDSIVSIRLVSRARASGLTITARQIFQHPTPAGLASVAKGAQTAPARPVDDGVGTVPLPPIAQWFASRGGPVGRFCQARLVRLPAGVREEELQSALQAVFDHHDGLRQRLTVHREGVWSAEAGPRGSLDAREALSRVDASGLDGEELRALVARESDRAADALEPAAGRTVRAVLLDAGPDRSGRLLLVAHHLVVDEVSWQILLPDLRSAWEAAVAGRAPALDPVPTSLRTWTTGLLAEAQSPRRVAELERWLAADGCERTLTDRPLDAARDTVASARDLSVRLSAERTAPLLESVPTAFHGTVNDTLLTALALAVGDWAARSGRPGAHGPAVELEGHGREQELLPGADLTRTVGWLTSLYPLRLGDGTYDPAAVLAGEQDAGSALKAVKELLRAVPDGGVGAGLLRYANPATARLFDPSARPEILWNYLGRNTAGALSPDWGPAAEADALQVRPDPATPLSHALEINAEIENGPEGPRLAATFVWAGEALSQTVVGELADGWLSALDALAAWADTTTTGGRTPSDLDLVDLDQDQITMLEAMWREQQ